MPENNTTTNGANDFILDSFFDKKNKTDFRLVGLSKPKSATLNFLYSDKEIFWATIDMPDDRFKALWYYLEYYWTNKYIAEVQHDGFYEDGTPVNPIMIGFREWDLPINK